MELGVIADSHDNLDALEYWVDYFNQRDVDVLLHAGDLISPFCVPVLESFERTVYAVFGNNDGDRETLREKAEGTSVNFKEPPVTLDLTECSVLVSHKPSDLPDPLPASVDVVVHGHTHERRCDDDRDPVVVNPGESGGWLTGTSSALTLSVEESTVSTEFKLVPSP